jgi:hypothetical protein
MATALDQCDVELLNMLVTESRSADDGDEAEGASDGICDSELVNMLVELADHHDNDDNHLQSSDEMQSSDDSSSNPFIAGPSCDMQDGDSSGYKYLSIKNVPIDGKVNVAGVVRSFKPVIKSRGSDYYTTFALHDPSQSNAWFRVMAFNRHEESLPVIRERGDVVLLRRLVINEFNDYPQGSIKPYTAVHVFSGFVSDRLLPYWSSYNASLSTSDIELVSGLKKWRNGGLTGSCSFDNLKEGETCNVTGVVLAIKIIADYNACCISMFDGTMPPFPLFSVSNNLHNNTSGLSREVKNKLSCYTCDVLVTGEAVSYLLAGVELGNIIHLKNVNVTSDIDIPSADGVNPPIKIYSLTAQIETTTSFCKIKKNSLTYVHLKKRLSSVLYDEDDNHPSIYSYIALTHHLNADISTVSDITKSLPSQKHNCIFKAFDISVINIESIVVLTCDNCHRSYDHINNTVLPSCDGDVMMEVDGPRCLSCSNATPPVSSPLRYIYQFVLYMVDVILSSSSSNHPILPVLISGSEGLAFMGNIQPSNFYIDHTARCLAHQRLAAFFNCNPFILTNSLDDRPIIKCCIITQPSSGDDSAAVIYKLIDTL